MGLILPEILSRALLLGLSQLFSDFEKRHVVVGVDSSPHKIHGGQIKSDGVLLLLQLFSGVFSQRMQSGLESTMKSETSNNETKTPKKK
jgi:hypothetical protein